MKEETTPYDEAAHQVVELANRITDRNPDSDPWEVADGLLAGAVHYWLFARQPCEDPMCNECQPVSSAEQRLRMLLEIVEQSAQDSDYYHSANDIPLGRA